MLTGFWFGLGLMGAALVVVLPVLVAAAWWERRHPPPPPTTDEEPQEDTRPEWMKARSGKPYDPTAGYEPKRRSRRSGADQTTPPE